MDSTIKKLKTIKLPKVTMSKKELSTNNIITIWFLLLTFFIGYSHTTLNNRMNKIENEIGSIKKDIVNIRISIAKIEANQQIILDYIKNQTTYKIN